MLDLRRKLIWLGQKRKFLHNITTMQCCRLSCDVMKNKISTETVQVCSKEILYEEFKDSIMQMHPLKAHDLNGIPTLFFQKYWHIIGN